MGCGCFSGTEVTSCDLLLLLLLILLSLLMSREDTIRVKRVVWSVLGVHRSLVNFTPSSFSSVQCSHFICDLRCLCDTFSMYVIELLKKYLTHSFIIKLIQPNPLYIIIII